MKHLLILEILLEAASESPTHTPQQDCQQLKGTQLILWKADSPPDDLKSNSESRFKIIFGLRNNMPQQAIWRGLLEGFSQFVSVFIEAIQNFIFYFLHNKAAKHFLNYQRIYTYICFDF